jgi:hypothetical protein
LILGTSLLLVLEVVWLLMHLQILPNRFFQGTSQGQMIPAGHIKTTQREVRRRNFNSLIWETSEPDDTLYYYDSVLTLSQSSATLSLNQQAEIHLSENTLVTIEPQEHASNDQIRLKFTRGDLRARTPGVDTKIETASWTLNLNKGAEVSLRQTGSQDYEVEVLKGKLNFQNAAADQSRTLKENEVLKINDNKLAGTVAIENDLKFAGPERERIYSNETQTVVPLQWQGSAQKIEIIPQGQNAQTHLIEPTQFSEKLPLADGKYTLRLSKDGKVSAAKEIEVWQAPTIQLLSPFPRDRVKTNESVVFVWSHVPEVATYELVVKNLETGKISKKTSTDNFVFYTFDQEGEFQWTVQGIDQDGYAIPPTYSNDIYSLKNPLAAPKLKSPQLRVPASHHHGALLEHRTPERYGVPGMWWRLLVGDEAFAKSKHRRPANADTAESGYEAVFDWEPVEGADQYVIEISDTADFRTPRVSQTVKKTEFIWSDFPLGTYYWRVAAGTHRGRLGVFSEPAKVSLAQIPDSDSPSSSDGVVIRKKIEKEIDKDRAKVDTSDQEILKNVPAPIFDESRFAKKTEIVSEEARQLKDTYVYGWTPNSAGWDLQNNDLKGKYSGTSLGSFLFQTEQKLSPEKSYFLNFNYEQAKWQAGDAEQMPFQKDVNYTRAEADVWFGDNQSGWLRGGTVATVPVIKRAGNESATLDNQLAAGVSGYHLWGQDRWKNGTGLSALIGSGIFVFSNQNQFKYEFYRGDFTKLFVGADANLTAYFHGSDFNFGWSAGLMFGFEK